MKKSELQIRVKRNKNNTKDALQFVFDALNQGQQKKIVKNDGVKKPFDLYGVKY